MATSTCWCGSSVDRCADASAGAAGAERFAALLGCGRRTEFGGTAAALERQSQHGEDLFLGDPLRQVREGSFRPGARFPFRPPPTRGEDHPPALALPPHLVEHP